MGILSHGNILAVYFAASETEIQEGKQWYATAHRTAEAISLRYNLRDGANTVAGIIAALSPNNRWHKNILDAEALIKVYFTDGDYEAIKVSTYNANKEKAIRILEGEHPLDVLKGNKVRAFYHCIADNLPAVCIDGHAFSIWTGQRVTTTKTPTISDKLYNKIAADYLAATIVINEVTGSCYTAAQVQAITWITWRNIFKGGSK